jgi:hypothetical protein
LSYQAQFLKNEQNISIELSNQKLFFDDQLKMLQKENLVLKNQNNELLQQNNKLKSKMTFYSEKNQDYLNEKEKLKRQIQHYNLIFEQNITISEINEELKN